MLWVQLVPPEGENKEQRVKRTTEDYLDKARVLSKKIHTIPISLVVDDIQTLALGARTGVFYTN